MNVITITGDNDYLRTAEQQRLMAEFVATEGDFALEKIDGEETDFTRIQEALTSLPFLANKKMVAFFRPSANKQFVESAEALLTELPGTTQLLLLEPKFDKRSSLYKLLKKRTDFRDFSALVGASLVQWLVAAADQAGATLSRSDAQFLIERVGTNQQQLANELTKLALHDPHVTRQSIELLTEATPQSTIFELVDAAFAGNSKKTLALYEEQRRLKVEPIQIIAMLAWQLHILALVVAAGNRTADEIAREAKINPYSVRKTTRLAERISATQLKQLVADLLLIDRRSKRESIDLDDAMRHYLLQLAA